MLRVRLLLAAVIILPLLLWIYADYRWFAWAPGLTLLPLAMVLAAVAAAETAAMLRGYGICLHPIVAVIGSAGVVLASGAPVAWDLLGDPYPADCALGRAGWPAAAMAIAVMVAFGWEFRRYRAETARDHLEAIGFATLVIAYNGLLFSFLVLLRRFHDNYWGMAALFSVLFLVKMADTGAYAFGKLMGRRRLAPVLSPNKTVEGAVGAFVTAALSALVFLYLILPLLVGEDAAEGQSAPLWCLYGLVVAAAGMVGDLAESLLKRATGCKDSSSWLPGLGGVLDVFDSLLFAGPIAYLYWLTAWVGPS